MFSPPRSSLNSSNELDLYGNSAVDFEDGMVCALGPDQCWRCGRAKAHPYSKGVCPAIERNCVKCGKTGHFYSMCQGVSRTSVSKPVVTPAQQRHTAKVQRQRANEARTINNIDGIPEESIGGLGSGSESEGDDGLSEIINAIKKLTDKRKQKKFVNMIAVLETDADTVMTATAETSDIVHSINALSKLSFMHALFGPIGAKRVMKALMDIGSTCTLIHKAVLESFGKGGEGEFVVRPFGGQIASFSGDPVIGIGVVELSFDFGAGPIKFDFIVIEGKVPYGLVLGIDFHKKYKIVNYNSEHDSQFEFEGQRFPCHVISDPLTVAAIESTPVTAAAVAEAKTAIGAEPTIAAAATAPAVAAAAARAKSAVAETAIGAESAAAAAAKAKSKSAVAETAIGAEPAAAAAAKEAAAPVKPAELTEPEKDYSIRNLIGVTLKSGDCFFLPIGAKNVEQGMYTVALNKEVREKHIDVLQPIILLTSENSRSEKLQTNLQIQFTGPKGSMVTIDPQTLIGEIRPHVPEKKKDLEVLFVNHIRLVDKDDTEKLYVYPDRVEPSKEKSEAIDKAQERRRKSWTRDELRERSPWHQKVPEAFREDLLDVVQEFTPILTKSTMEDFREGLKYYELKGKMPKNVSLNSNYRPPGVVLRHIYSKAQQVMVESGVAEPTQRPAAIHPFSIVMKKGKKMPASVEEVERMSGDVLWSTVRIIQDCSLLTAKTEHPQGFLPPAYENLCKLEPETTKSAFDLAKCFVQMCLSADLDENGLCLRDFFSFVSAIVGNEYLRNTKLPMGFTAAMELACTIIKQILDRCSAVPLHCSLEHFLRCMKEMQDNKMPSAKGKVFRDQVISFADDGVVQTPTEKLEQYGLQLHSYYKKPKNSVEAAIYLHLQVLRKVFSHMQMHNLLITPEKMSLLCGSEFEYLGFRFSSVKDSVAMMAPEAKLRVLKEIPIPKNVRELQSFIGFCSFFSCLLQNGKALMAPLLKLIRKETAYTWEAEQQRCFDTIKQRLGNTMLLGFLKLTNGRDLQDTIVYTDWALDSRAVSGTVYVKTYTDRTMQVALFWSRLLSTTFDKKPPFMCELAGVVSFLLSNKHLVAGKLLHMMCDNMVAVGILRRRLTLVDSFDDGIVHRLLYSIAGYPFRISYVNSLCNAADFTSRYSKDHGMTFGEILESSNSIVDMKFLDEQSAKPPVQLEQYLIESQKCTELVKVLESEEWSEDQLRENYRSTHFFLNNDDDIISALAGAEVQDLFPTNSSREHNKSTEDPDVLKWAEDKKGDNIKFSKPEKLPFLSHNCPNLFKTDEEDDADDDFFVTKKNKDLIDFITSESGRNEFTPEYMAVLREDSHYIATEPVLCNSISSSMDGILDESIYESRQLLSTYLQEVNVIFSLLDVEGGRPEENLFKNWEELRQNAEKYKISEAYSKKMPYLLEVQRRSKAISLIKRILQKEEVSEMEVDHERRTDTLFQILYNNQESLFIMHDLVFRAKFPKKGESHHFCVVLENSDAERRLVSLHSKEHRGHLYLYTIFSKDFYTPSGFRLAYDVTSRCPNCCQMKSKKKTKCQRNNLTCSSLNTWAVDMKGPCMVGNTKKYILCAVELNLRLVHFSLANSLDATEIARLLFDGIIASYGSSVEIFSDRGRSFLNKISQALFTLGSVHHRLSSSYHPQSSIVEGISVRRFSSSMKALICGKNLSEWSQNIKYLQVLLNSALIHPHLNQTPYQLLLNSKSTFYHPVLENPEMEMPFGVFWEKRIKKFQAMTKVLKEKYDVYICSKGNPRNTVDSMGIKVGQTIWIKIHAYSSRLAYLTTLLPRYKAAKVVEILGKSSLALEDLETGRLINRHLSDCYPIRPTGNFSNLFTDSKIANQSDVEEDFGGMTEKQIPEVMLDSTAVDQLKRNEEALAQTGEKTIEKWSGRLRKQKRVNYKD